jgi:hypothetical protein
MKIRTISRSLLQRGSATVENHGTAMGITIAQWISWMPGAREAATIGGAGHNGERPCRMPTWPLPQLRRETAT